MGSVVIGDSEKCTGKKWIKMFLISCLTFRFCSISYSQWVHHNFIGMGKYVNILNISHLVGEILPASCLSLATENDDNLIFWRRCSFVSQWLRRSWPSVVTVRCQESLSRWWLNLKSAPTSDHLLPSKVFRLHSSWKMSSFSPSLCLCDSELPVWFSFFLN